MTFKYKLDEDEIKEVAEEGEEESKVEADNENADNLQDPDSSEPAIQKGDLIVS